MLREAGLLQPPPAMVEAITEWVQAANADLFAALGPRLNKSAIRKFPMDLSGWRYSNSPLIKGLKKFPPEWKAITVTLALAASSLDRNDGNWDPKTHNLTIKLRFKQDPNKLELSVRHELQHMTQSFMDDLASLSDSVAPRPGMPSRHIMTPQHSQALMLYDDSKSYAENYVLDDMEFYPQLTDMIRESQKAVGAKDTEQDQKEYLLKVLNGDVFVQMGIWKRLAPGKWKKAVKEFYRVFPVLANTASRVASTGVRQAGLLEPPPAMGSAITEWVQAQAAANLSFHLKSEIKRMQDISGEMARIRENVERLREEMPQGSPRSLEVWTLRVQYVIPKIKGAPSRKQFQTMTPETRPQIIETLTEWCAQIEQWVQKQKPNTKAIGILENQLARVTPYLRGNTRPFALGSKKFPMDLTGWKYETDTKKITSTGWDHIVVTMSLRLSNVGWWDSSSKDLVLNIPENLTLDDLEHELPSTISHEMQHVAQDILKVIKGQGAGLPSKHIRTPEHKQDGAGAGQLGLHNPAIAVHDLDDDEFYPMLDTEIRTLKMNIRGLSPEKQKKYILWFVGVDKDKPLFVKTAPSAAFKVWKERAPAKWKKGLKEVFKAFPGLANSPSPARVASRWIRSNSAL